MSELREEFAKRCRKYLEEVGFEQLMPSKEPKTVKELLDFVEGFCKHLYGLGEIQPKNGPVPEIPLTVYVQIYDEDKDAYWFGPIIVTSVSDDLDKSAFCYLMTMFCQDFPVMCYLVVSEAWKVTRDGKDFSGSLEEIIGISPSADPERKECLSILGVSRDKQEYYKDFEILRNDEGFVKELILDDDCTDKPAQNAFLGAFQTFFEKTDETIN